MVDEQAPIRENGCGFYPKVHPPIAAPTVPRVYYSCSYLDAVKLRRVRRDFFASDLARFAAQRNRGLFLLIKYLYKSFIFYFIFLVYSLSDLVRIKA